MKNHQADRTSEVALRSYLERQDLSFLHVRRYNDLLILESGPNEDRFPHARFRRDTIHLWRLEMPVHGGKRWEKPPIRGPLLELMDALIQNFPWTLISPFQEQRVGT